MRLMFAHLRIYADHHQFYLKDPKHYCDSFHKFTKYDMKNRIKSGKHIVIVLPRRDLYVPVGLEIHSEQPTPESEAWDHIVEASLHLLSGRIQVDQCSYEPIAEFKVEPGWYRVRSYQGGLDSINGLDGNDYYKICIWRSKKMGVKLLKEWKPR